VQRRDLSAHLATIGPSAGRGWLHGAGPGCSSSAAGAAGSLSGCAAGWMALQSLAHRCPVRLRPHAQYVCIQTLLSASHQQTVRLLSTKLLAKQFSRDTRFQQWHEHPGRLSRAHLLGCHSSAVSSGPRSPRQHPPVISQPKKLSSAIASDAAHQAALSLSCDTSHLLIETPTH
jgi:hypothetical protein